MKWEYSVISASSHLTDKQLNETFGQEGWELVTITNAHGEPHEEGRLLHVFKRPILEN